MSQSRTICDCSSVGFGSSGERSSSFKAWPGFVLLRWFHSDDSKAFARSSKPAVWPVTVQLWSSVPPW